VIAGVTLMDAQRAGPYGDPAGWPGGSHNKPTKGIVIFTSFCVVILLVFFAYFAWCLLTSS